MAIDLRGMNAAETTEIIERFGWMASQLEKHLISHDPPARHIPASGFRFPPGRQLTKYRSPFGFERFPASNSLIAFLRLTALFSHRGFESSKFLLDPLQTAERIQPILQMRMD
jgi:hypothetical protein